MSLHECTYNGRIKILLALKDPQMASMPAVAVLNYLSLKDETGIPPPKIGKEMDLAYELSVLLTRAFRARNIPEPPDTVANLTVDTTIKPYRQGSIFDFTHDEDECEADKELFSLCESLDIKLYHGCIADSQNPANAGERGLTQYGLDCLTRDITEGELALLFRNGDLNIVCKHAGHLFLLETDKETLDGDGRDDYMWKTLTLHKQQEVLFTKSFCPIALSLQPNGKKKAVARYISAWDDELKRETEALVLDLTKQVKIQKAKNGSKKNKTGDKHGDVQDHGRSSENKESVTAQSTKAAVDEYKWAKDKFRDFLETYVDPEEEAPERYPFYLRLVEAWKELKAVKRPHNVIIHYHHIEHYDKHLALALLNDRARLRDVFSQVFLEFRLDNNCGRKAQLNGRVKVRILGMSRAESMCKFEEFVKSNKTQLTKPHPLFDKKTLRSPTYMGRIAGKGAAAAATVSFGESSRPYWVLLNMYAQVGKNPNKTTAHCNGRNGVTLESSLVCERPPLPSNLFVYCSGATFGKPPCLLSMVDNLILFYVYIGPVFGFPTPRTSDFFMYRADPKRPSLKLLSNLEGRVSREHTFGIFPRGEDHYTIAALIPLGYDRNLFSLHLYDSETDTWSWKKLYVESPQKSFPVEIPGTHHTSTVLTLGKTIGWVDHWRGIVFCDMLSEKHTLSGIPLPLPLKCMEPDVHSSKTLGAARYERGIAVINGCLRLVEVGLKAVSDVPDVYDEETGWPCCRTENWMITTWTNKKMGNSFDDWHMDCTVLASEIFLGDHSESELPPIDLQNLFVSDPTIGLNENGSEVIYLTARVKFMHPKSWVLAIDTRDCKVQSLVVRPGPLPQEMRFIDAKYCTCSIYK